MDSLQAVTAFFGWTTAINFMLLLFSSIMLITMRRAISRIHGKMFGVAAADLSRAYFQYLAQYKIAVIVFSLTPYVALKFMA
ncbi:MAG TPA: hypothetical protein PKH39_00230 [Woeseiaceae bacterium]|nr:hypothetical protein [Woeseiaceae bacterium]